MPTTPKGYPYPDTNDKIGTYPTQARTLAEKVNDQLGIVKSGQVSSGALSTGVVKSVAVSFPGAFPGTPRVTVAAYAAVPHQRMVSVYDVTPTGFTAAFINTASTSAFAAEWIARY